MSDPEYLLELRALADHAKFYVQWKCEGIYLNTTQPIVNRQIIGYSVQHRPIETVVFTPPNYSKTILCTFALHGFEDVGYRDGQQLVQIAEELIQWYSVNLNDLNFTRLIIIPCVNPDGTYAGTTKNGFGRCNSQGVDLNRDFDFNWGFISESRFKTGYTAFSAPESQILRDFVLTERPDNGWLNCCYSQSPGIKTLFTETFPLGAEKPADRTKYKEWQGYFSGWASQYTESALIEYPFRETSILAEKTIQALDQLIQN